MKQILCFLFCLGVLAPVGWSAETHAITLDQDRPEPIAFGTTLFGFGKKNENTGIWPCNFWSNFNEKDFAYDLETLKLEGANTVIVLFPFFDVDDPTPPGDIRLGQLKKVLELCETHGISLILRVGYAWDNGFYNFSRHRQTELLVDPKMRQKWYKFCDATYALASKHSSFRGGFICWEDFWGLLAGASLDEAGRKTWAARIHYPRDIVPAKGEPEMEEYFEHFDTVLADDFFVNTQAHFPELGMEVRMDDDPIFKNGTVTKWFVHKKQFAAPNLNNVYIYWAAFMGARNEGDLLSADNAVHLLLYALEKARRLSAPGAQLLISQFNYRDNTPGTSRNSQVAPDQLDDFLHRSSRILSYYCTGIFTWSNTSYFHNAINNGTFADGSRFWTFHHALAGIEDSQPAVSVFPGGTVSQRIELNVAVSAGLIDADHAQLAFSAKAASGTSGTVSLGGKSEKVVMKGKDQWYRYEVNWDKPRVAGETLDLSFPSGAVVDDIVLTNHKQTMGATNPDFPRDSTYADLAWEVSSGQPTPPAPAVLSGVTEDQWIMSRANFTVPAQEGRYRIAINLSVPESIKGQSVLVSLHPDRNPPTRIELKHGQHQLNITGRSAGTAVLLTLAFEHHQKLSPDSPDVRELAAHLDSIAP